MRLLAIPVLALSSACATSIGAPEPSLDPRSGEAIDPRLPIADRSDDDPADPAFANQLAELVRSAEAAQAKAELALSVAEQAARVAGPRGSERWIEAQQLLSAAVAARRPVTQAVGDIDALGSRRLLQTSWISPSNLTNLQQAAEAVARLDLRQADRISRMQATLGPAS